MTDELIKKDGKLTVQKTDIGGKTTETEETIEVTPFETTPANISVKGGCTVNLGDYNSGRVDVMLSMPVIGRRSMKCSPR